MAKKRKSSMSAATPAEMFKLAWHITADGTCILGTQGASFGGFVSARGAADFLRDVAARIEQDAQALRPDVARRVAVSKLVTTTKGE